MLLLFIYTVSAVLLLRPPTLAPQRACACAPRRAVASRVLMVSERHNQAYKQTIELFSPLSRDEPMHEFAAHEVETRDALGRVRCLMAVECVTCDWLC